MGNYDRTCKWCGKRYDPRHNSGVRDPYNYCSVRCESKAKSEQQKESQRQKEAADDFFRLIGGGNAKKGGCISVVLFFGVIMIYTLFFSNSSNQESKEKVEEVHEKVNTQQQSEDVYQLEQAMPVANQSELVFVGEEINDDWLPEPLEITEDQGEEVDVDIEMESEDIELEEEVRPDYSSQKVYDIVDEMPDFPNGDHELMKYIADNLEYPQEAIDGDVQGTVFVKIIVEPDGSVSNAKIIRGIGSGCDEEAIRVIESMPNWESGRKKGEAVRVYMAVPVSFKLH